MECTVFLGLMGCVGYRGDLNNSDHRARGIDSFTSTMVLACRYTGY